MGSEGSFFECHEWQHEWFDEGIVILPLGTGIGFDWVAGPTTWKNLPILGTDATLITKHDFKSLVEKVVFGSDDSTCDSRFGNGVVKETVIDLVSA